MNSSHVRYPFHRLLVLALTIWFLLIAVGGGTSAAASVTGLKTEVPSASTSCCLPNSESVPVLVTGTLSEPVFAFRLPVRHVVGTPSMRMTGRAAAPSVNQRSQQCPTKSGLSVPATEASRCDAHELLRVSRVVVATKACSFGGETLVLMADGSTKPISEIEPGDMVLAQDPETGEIGARRVTDAWVHDDDLVRLEIDGDVVRTTEDHPFWNDTDKQWQRADQLDTGDYVLTAEGRRVKVGVLISAAGRGSAYNFTVEGLHTYHVLFGTDAVLVHNECPLVELAENGALRPEAGYLRGKKHGLTWGEGAATAKSTGKAQGQWGSAADLDYAGNMAGSLAPGQSGWFPAPPGTTSKVFLPDGSVVPATRIWVRNNGSGTFHGYPAP